MANKWGIPADVEAAVLERDKRCVYCGAEFGQDRRTKWSWEHIVNDIRISTIDNIALCCCGCNSSKRAKHLREWLSSPHAKRRGITNETLAPVVLAALERLG